MNTDIYYYLKDYGFNDDEIDAIENTGEDMYYTNLLEIRKNIKFLEEKGLDSGQIIDAVNYNPYLLTEKNNRLEAFDDIFSDLLFSSEELKKIIIANPDIYTASPIELKKIISYLKKKNYTEENIKKLFIKLPLICSYDYDEYLKLLDKSEA